MKWGWGEQTLKGANHVDPRSERVASGGNGKCKRPGSSAPVMFRERQGGLGRRSVGRRGAWAALSESKIRCSGILAEEWYHVTFV